MADIKISQLSPVLSVQDADVFPMTANGSNMTGKAAASTIKHYMIGNTSIAGIGDGTPTGAIKNLSDKMPGGPEDLGIGYGTCNTAAATLAKEASLTGYELVKNGYVSVLFTYNVPAGANLSINSKTAKSIYYHGSAITAGIINAGDVATFVYDGVNYNLVGVDNSITQIENLKTNQGTLSSLTTTAKSSLVAAINEVDGDVDAAFDSIAPTEDGVTVSQDYAIGEEFYRGGVLYKAKTAITASTAWSSLVLNTNYEATTVGSEIQALTNKTSKIIPYEYIVWLGDSYTYAGSLDTDIDKRYATLVSNMLGLTEKMYAVGGCGFVTGRTPYTTQATIAVADFNANNLDKNLVKYCVIGGNRNDGIISGGDAPAYESAVATTINTLATNFPNAEIIIIPMMWDWKLLPVTYLETIKRLKTAVNMLMNTPRPVRIIENCYTWLTGQIMHILWQNGADVHPDVEGHRILASHVYSAIKGNEYDNNSYLADFGTWNSANTISENHISIAKQNGIIHVHIQFACDYIGNTIVWSWSTPILGDLTERFIGVQKIMFNFSTRNKQDNSVPAQFEGRCTKTDTTTGTYELELRCYDLGFVSGNKYYADLYFPDGVQATEFNVS